MNLNDDISLLIGSYGIVAVHKALQKRMKDDYEYLKTLFDEVKEKKQIVKEEKKNVEKEVIPEVKDANEVVDLPNDSEEKTEEKKYRDPKEMKVWQKEQEDKKRKENEAKGIKPKDLLTKENLKKWIEDEGRTYSYIAREHVGCKDTEVSAAAKAFNIENTRKQVTIQAKK